MPFVLRRTGLRSRVKGSALADGMSLALANMALREKLRNQALRDPLTGLYNRRYMKRLTNNHSFSMNSMND